MIKKIIALLLCVAMSTTFFIGCNENDNDNEENNENKVMKIGCFNDPFVNEDSYKTLAASGINRVFVNKTRSHSAVLNILNYCDSLDIDVVVLSSINNKVLYNNDYMSHKSFAGINIKDEPSADEYETIAEKISTFESIYTDKLFYVNLFPDPETNYDKLGTENYEEYIEEYCETVLEKLSGEKVLSFDIYPLERSGAYNIVQSRYLSNLEIVAEYAKKYGASPQVYLQAMGYAKRRQPDLVDLNFQAYCSFAFGYQSLIYFCYYTPGPNSEFTEEDYAIVDRENNPTEIYDYVKSLNDEIFKFDGAYLNYKWQETIPVYGDNDSDDQLCLALMNNQKDKVGNIKTVNAQYDAVIGHFKNGNKNAYMVTNFTEPTKRLTNKVILEFANDSSLEIYIDGEKQAMQTNGGVIELSIPSGEGVFVIEN